MKFEVEHIEDLSIVSDYIIQFTKEQKIFCFFGNLGAGKTTLINQICQKLGITDDVSSPTYSIIQEYQYNDEIVVHVDLYRIKSIEEIIDIGLESYLYQNICFIEWADDFLQIIPTPYVKVEIQQKSGLRKIDINIVH